MSDRILKIGVFGCWRGGSYIQLLNAYERTEVVAICDKNTDMTAGDRCPATAKAFTDFDEFLSYGKSVGMEAVFLCNYFHQHAPFAIKCMEAGMDVVSECTSASTLKECVELVECVERTGRKYMIAENYPFMAFNMKMREMVAAGEIGTPLYAEGEYNHSGSEAELRNLGPNKYHWRCYKPRTYYNTHAMGPLMYIGNCMPKYVSARAAHSKLMEKIKDARHDTDGTAIMFCEMDNGMIARFTGCTAMASDYSRYRIVGDVSSLEAGGYVDNVRQYWFHHTRPEGQEEMCKTIPAVLDDEAAAAGHGGGDWWIVHNLCEYFLDGKKPFFDVYKGVAMSAAAILGWRSCLNHGENYRIPDFSDPADRESVRNDDLTPFPDENGEGATLPSCLPY